MKKASKIVVLLGFAIYVLALVNILLVNRIRTTYNLSLPEYIRVSVNLVPFRSLFEYFIRAGDGTMNLSTAVSNLLGNFVIFMPMGFFLPVLFKSTNSIKKFLLVVTLAITAAEVFQLIFQIGQFDIDDFILRISGALLVFGFWKAVSKTYSQKSVSKS